MDESATGFEESERSSEGKSTNFIRHNKESDKFEFVESEADVFKSPEVTASTFLNIVSILGLVNTGKSTLMNRVIGEDVFETKNSSKGFTKGAWVSNDVRSVGDGGAFLFVDTEGQGDNDLGNDIALLTPVMMLSKVIVLRTSSEIPRRYLLDTLELFVQIADRIKLEGSFMFGHLIIAVKDYSSEETKEDVYNYCFGKENGETEAERTRNTIREKVLSLFKSIKVLLFPYPFKERERSKVQSQGEQQTNEDFNERVNELKTEILENVKEPYYFAGNTCLKSDNFINITKKIVDESNLKGSKVMSVARLLLRVRIDEAAKQFRNNLLKKIDELILPVNSFQETLVRIKEKLVMEFMEETKKEEVSEYEYRNQVKDELDRFYKERFHQKEKESKTLVKRIKREEKEAGEAVGRVLDTIPFQPQGVNLEEELERVTDEIFERFKRSLEGVGDNSEYKKQVETEIEERFQRMRENKMNANRKCRDQLDGAKREFETALKASFDEILQEFPVDPKELEKRLKLIFEDQKNEFIENTQGINMTQETSDKVVYPLQLYYSDAAERMRLTNYDRQGFLEKIKSVVVQTSHQTGKYVADQVEKHKGAIGGVVLLGVAVIILFIGFRCRHLFK